MKKACFIIPYFGRFPNYYSLWLQSAGRQTDYDFIFLTDIPFDKPLPENVKFVRMSFEDIVQRVRDVLKIEPALSDAYKLCDFKPAYGFLFPEIIAPYPFWGFVDIDLILGDISHFIKDIHFEKFDKIGVQGHLMMLRNCEKVNRLFMTDTGGRFPEYKAVFQNEYSYHFDESGLFANSDEFGVRSCVAGHYYDVMAHRFPFLARVSADEFCPVVVQYKDGKLLMHRLIGSEIDTIETMYVHFQKRTMSVEIDVEAEEYLMVPNRFIPTRQIDPAFIREVNADRIYWDWHKRRLKMIVQNLRHGAIKNRLTRKRG